MSGLARLKPLKFEMISELLSFLGKWRRRRRALKTRATEPGYPDSAIDVVEIDQAIRSGMNIEQMSRDLHG